MSSGFAGAPTAPDANRDCMLAYSETTTALLLLLVPCSSRSRNTSAVPAVEGWKAVTTTASAEAFRHAASAAAIAWP